MLCPPAGAWRAGQPLVWIFKWKWKTAAVKTFPLHFPLQLRPRLRGYTPAADIWSYLLAAWPGHTRCPSQYLSLHCEIYLCNQDSFIVWEADFIYPLCCATSYQLAKACYQLDKASYLLTNASCQPTEASYHIAKASYKLTIAICREMMYSYMVAIYQIFTYVLTEWFCMGNFESYHLMPEEG